MQAFKGADSFGLADARGGHVDGSAVVVEVQAVLVGSSEIIVKGLGVFSIKSPQKHGDNIPILLHRLPGILGKPFRVVVPGSGQGRMQVEAAVLAQACHTA